MEAYSNPEDFYGKIAFCNRFFNKLRSLDFAIDKAKKNPGAYQNNLEKYDNRARHPLNYFVDDPNSVPYVDDLKIHYGAGKKVEYEVCYGPEIVPSITPPSTSSSTG